MQCNTPNSAIQKPRSHDERLCTAWPSAPAPPWRGSAARWPKRVLKAALWPPRRRSPARRAISVRAAPRPPISGTPTLSRSTHPSTTSPSPTRRSSASTPGCCGAEGPAWSAQGRYLLWSDIPNNRQMRWSEDDGHVSVFRYPSNNSNGNSFDFQGRQLSCEHLTRRVVRYEHDGTVSVLADNFNGKKFNSPNDVVAYPDGSYWFTDPPYGGQLYEGEPDAPSGASNAAGKLNPRIGQPAGFVPGKRELPTNCYRVDPSGRLDLVVSEDQVPDPNGLAFSPDYKKLYVASTGKGPGDTGPGGKGDMSVFDVGANNKLANQKRFSDFMIDDVKCGPDGVRCDVNGNVWASSNAGRHVGYSGVTVWTPDGKLIGRIRLPEVCGNICFGGPKRNRLFMAASQSA